MEKVYIEDKTFTKVDFKNHPLAKGEYEHCRFLNCDFSDSDLSEYTFADCVFSACNFSMVKLLKTAFRDVKFTDSKMLGLHFELCNDFGLFFVLQN